MKKLIVSSTLLSLVACSSVNHNSRTVASVAPGLEGTFLGVSNYGLGHDGPDKAATRIYFHPIKEKAGNYNVVLLEYVDLLKMAPGYVASNKLPIIANKTGYLKNITSKIFVYEAVPGTKAGTYELFPLVVAENGIHADGGAKPRVLRLSPGAKSGNPLAGATLSSVREDDPKEIFFPVQGDDKFSGAQYHIAKTAYEKVGLESTWRTNFLKGPYLSQYYKKDDVVLKLSGSDAAEFVLNPKFAKMPKSERAEMFTNTKSAFLKGNFSVSEPRDGMFLFNTVKATKSTTTIVEGKIGLFIDIFDATKALGQDVVELALINTEDPTDFLMYYEDPANGEGADANLR